VLAAYLLILRGGGDDMSEEENDDNDDEADFTTEQKQEQEQKQKQEQEMPTEKEKEEGFQEGIKFPSASSITKPIMGKVSEATKLVKTLPKIAQKESGKAAKAAGKVAKNATKKVTGQLGAIEKKATAAFARLIGFVTSAVTLVTNLPQCTLWYMLHALGYALYAPVALLVWAMSLGWLERLVWDYIGAADRLAHAATGVYPFRFSSSVRERCYFAKKEPSEPVRAADDEDGGTAGEDANTDDSALLGLLVLGMLVLAAGWAAVAGARAAAATND
jgi:hypothetical protein